MKKSIIVIICVLVGVAILLILGGTFSSKDSYIHPGMYQPSNTFGYPYYYQNLPPSLHVENNYHRCVIGECQGDYENYECRQKCYLKTMKDGTFDRADLICYNEGLKGDDAYYQCLDSVYGNYIWMDRNTGVGSCKCPNGTTSYRDQHTQECICRDHPPLKYRTPMNEFGETLPYGKM